MTVGSHAKHNQIELRQCIFFQIENLSNNLLILPGCKTGITVFGWNTVNIFFGNRNIGQKSISGQFIIAEL